MTASGGPSTSGSRSHAPAGVVVPEPPPVGTHAVGVGSYLVLDPVRYGVDVGIVDHNRWTITVKP